MYCALRRSFLLVNLDSKHTYCNRRAIEKDLVYSSEGVVLFHCGLEDKPITCKSCSTY